MQGLFCRGKFRRGETSPPLQILKLTLPHAHTALPKPPDFATFLKDEVFLRNCPRLKVSPLCDSPSGCCFFTGPWTVTRSSLRMLRRVAAFCRPLQPVLLLVMFPRLWSPVVGVLGLCCMWHGVPFAISGAQ